MHSEPARLGSLVRWLSQPRAPLVVGVLACLLMLPAVAGGFALDDHVLALKARAQTGIAGLASQPLALFTFTTGRTEDNHALMDQGALLPWWTDPQHLNAFFRPLSCLTHLLDFQLWPSSPALMHLHSIVWFALLLCSLAQVYRRLASEPAWLFGLAFLLYALDDAHGATVGWISNRNAIVSAALALPALAAHVRWRAQAESRAVWLAVLWFALGLCAGETAIALLGYLIAYAVVLDRGSVRQRLASLAPYVAVLLVHRVAYHVLGLGSFGSAGYHDPLHEPWAFVHALAYNLPVLLGAQLGVPAADVAFWGNMAQRGQLYVLSWLTLLALGWLCAPLLRWQPQARFWALGMLLSAVPVSASIPGERLLLMVGVGAAPLLALLLTAPDFAQPAQALGQRWLLSGLALIHLVAAPLGLPARTYLMQLAADAADRIDASVGVATTLPEQTLVVINAPVTIMLSYLRIARVHRGIVAPAHVHWLAAASSRIHVLRSGERSLRVTLDEGFLRKPDQTHYRSDLRALSVGDEVELSQLRAKVIAVTAEAGPKTVEFEFESRLDSPRYLFRQYRAGRLWPWQPPTLGASVSFPAEDFARMLLFGPSS